MKEARCPACPEVFADKTELGAMIKLVEHLKSIPETEHLKFLDVRLAELERLIDRDGTASMKLALLDKCVNLDERLKAIHLLAASTLSMAVDRILDLLMLVRAIQALDRRTLHSPWLKTFVRPYW